MTNNKFVYYIAFYRGHLLSDDGRLVGGAEGGAKVGFFLGVDDWKSQGCVKCFPVGGGLVNLRYHGKHLFYNGAWFPQYSAWKVLERVTTKPDLHPHIHTFRRDLTIPTPQQISALVAARLAGVV